MIYLNVREATAHIESGGIVWSGGYTLGKGIYFGGGTYPGCIRGGDTSDLSKYPAGDSREWIPVTEKDIVCRVGYQKCQFIKPFLNDGTVDFDELWKYLTEEIRLTDEELSNPMKNSEHCKNFFTEKEKLNPKKVGDFYEVNGYSLYRIDVATNPHNGEIDPVKVHLEEHEDEEVIKELLKKYQELNPNEEYGYDAARILV